MGSFDALKDILTTIYKKAEIPGLAFAQYAPGKEPILHSFGSTIATAGVPITKNTVFQLASVSKLITATLVLDLAKDNLLDLGEIVTQGILNAWPEAKGIISEKDHITWANLLTHRGGFVDQGGLLGVASSTDQLAEVTEWKANADQSYSNEKIGMFNYSACGYWTIQTLLSNRFNTNFSNLLQNRLLIPLKMDKTSAGEIQGHEENHTCGHINTTMIQNCYNHFPNCEAVAGVWSSAFDLWLFMRHLLRTEDKNSENARSTPKVILRDLINTTFAGSYRYGIYQIHDNGEVFYGHTGLNRGFSSGLLLDDARSSGIAFLINREIPEPVMQSFLKLGCALMRNDEPKKNS